ncbi:hypothetical protein Syun_031449 [Stephania yunnanensis]|uniref:Protein kinase domain-containing protein n=1 Tax=Stephania yunnanensis TaxID=152371 RepID=A0AAP0HGM9_9MAGN
MVAHVGDFGLAKFLQRNKNNDLGTTNSTSSFSPRGTVGYIPPVTTNPQVLDDPQRCPTRSTDQTKGYSQLLTMSTKAVFFLIILDILQHKICFWDISNLLDL